jgi:WD40 repeat protein
VFDLSTITAHKKQVNCCHWNANGNWLATGSTDGMIKIFDIRIMKEMESMRGQNSEVRTIKSLLFYFLFYCLLSSFFFFSDLPHGLASDS